MVAQIIELIIMQWPGLRGSWILSPNSATEAGKQAWSFKSKLLWQSPLSVQQMVQ